MGGRKREIVYYMCMMEGDQIGNKPEARHWKLLIVAGVVIGIYIAFRGLDTTSNSTSDIEALANTPSPNQGVVTEEDRASIELVRNAPSTEPTDPNSNWQDIANISSTQ